MIEIAAPDPGQLCMGARHATKVISITATSKNYGYNLDVLVFFCVFLL
ncbi:MAG TPA: hypothetical protein VFI31_15975 [Pirellulales bacterium]|nr:hypothetical protein [Pirellulales bacterium]